MAKLSALSVFFPCHNEEGNVENLTKRCQDYLPKIADDFEIIIVNDGSKDRTKEIADRLASEDPRVRPIHHEVNKGYGGALQSGFEAAKHPYVFFTDGDGQFAIEDLEPFAKAILEGADAAVGYRINRKDPLHRRLNAWAWTSLVNLLFSLKIRDVDCAYKLIRRDKLEGLTLKSEGALISTELLARLRKRGCKFVELPVEHHARTAGEQSGGNPLVILRAFKELFKFYGELKEEDDEEDKDDKD